MADSHEDLVRVTQKEYDMFMSLSDVTYDNFDTFRNIVCENFKMDLNREAHFITDNLISQYVTTTQNEIFHVNQAFPHYFLYADFKTIKIFNFDLFFPFVLARYMSRDLRNCCFQIFFQVQA